MATFRVGQRVRIVRFNGEPHLVGREAICMEFFMYGSYPSWRLSIDGGLTDIDPKDGCRLAAWENDIVPIQPERNRLVAWEDLGLPFDPRKVAEEIA